MVAKGDWPQGAVPCIFGRPQLPCCVRSTSGYCCALLVEVDLRLGLRLLILGGAGKKMALNDRSIYFFDSYFRMPVNTSHAVGNLKMILKLMMNLLMIWMTIKSLRFK